MLDFFGWIKRRAKEAVLGGVVEALDELDANGQPPPDLEAARKRLAAPELHKQLSPKADDEPEAGKGRRGK